MGFLEVAVAGLLALFLWYQVAEAIVAIPGAAVSDVEELPDGGLRAAPLPGYLLSFRRAQSSPGIRGSVRQGIPPDPGLHPH